MNTVVRAFLVETTLFSNKGLLSHHLKTEVTPSPHFFRNGGGGGGGGGMKLTCHLFLKLFCPLLYIVLHGLQTPPPFGMFPLPLETLPLFLPLCSLLPSLHLLQQLLFEWKQVWDTRVFLQLYATKHRSKSDHRSTRTISRKQRRIWAEEDMRHRYRVTGEGGENADAV